MYPKRGMYIYLALPRIPGGAAYQRTAITTWESWMALYWVFRFALHERTGERRNRMLGLHPLASLILVNLGGVTLFAGAGLWHVYFRA